jgi:hypothetical protein
VTATTPNTFTAHNGHHQTKTTTTNTNTMTTV